MVFDERDKYSVRTTHMIDTRQNIGTTDPKHVFRTLRCILDFLQATETFVETRAEEGIAGGSGSEGIVCNSLTTTRILAFARAQGGRGRKQRFLDQNER